jgi:hypothetical protein
LGPAWDRVKRLLGVADGTRNGGAKFLSPLRKQIGPAIAVPLPVPPHCTRSKERSNRRHSAPFRAVRQRSSRPTRAHGHGSCERLIYISTERRQLRHLGLADQDSRTSCAGDAASLWARTCEPSAVTGENNSGALISWEFSRKLLTAQPYEALIDRNKQAGLLIENPGLFKYPVGPRAGGSQRVREDRRDLSVHANEKSLADENIRWPQTHPTILEEARGVRQM